MRTVARIRLGLTALTLSAVVVLAAVVPPVAAREDEPRVLPSESKPFGKTYGEWSVEFWKYVLEVEASRSALNDSTGARCAERQRGSVFFLVGVLGAGSVVRTQCKIPAGKALFFPLLNQVNVATVPADTERSLRADIAPSIDNARNLFARVGDNQIGNLRAGRAKSPVFSLRLLRDNLFGLPARTYRPAVADGIYLMLAPLSPGEYVLRFGGTFPDGGVQNITYRLKVEGSHRGDDDDDDDRRR